MPGVGTAALVKIAYFVVVAAATAYSAIKSNKALKKGDSMSDASSGGLRANTRSTQEQLKVTYGKLRVGGNDVYMTTTGTDNNILWIVQTLAEGECDSIDQVDSTDQVFLADKLYNEYGGNVAYYFHSGTSSQSVDSNLNTAKGEWTDTLRNVCYIVFKLTYDQNYFQNLPARQVVLKGRKLTDFRDSPPTEAWSDNPVLALYDYMTNSRYGLGFAAAAFDLTTWTSAANYCDTKNWTLNMGIGSDEQAWDVVNNILLHFRGTLIWYDGKFYLRYADLNYESSLMTITDAHLVQDEAGRAQVSIAEPTRFQRPDFMKVVFIDPDKGYVADEIPIGDDTGVSRELALTGCTDRDQAAQLGVYNLEREQLDRRVTGLFRDDVMQLEPHDVVTVTLTALSISAQLMRVIDVQIQPDGLVALTLLYEETTLYDDDYNLVTENIYTCSLPDPTAEPPAVSNVDWAEETYNYRLRTFSRLNITFDPPVNYNWFKEIEVWRSFDDANWEHMFNTTNDFSIDPIEEGQGIYVRLKTVSIFGTKSPDNGDYKIYKYIDGYADVPTSLTSLQAIANANSVNLYSAKVSDPDIELYEFRLGSSWSGAIFLAALRSPNLSLSGVKPSGSGGHTFYCSTLSNNGTYGATPRTANVVITDPPDGWTVQNTETCDYTSSPSGTHDNTEHTTYDSDDYLKCSHGSGVLAGTYTSPVYDLGASGRYMVYCLADIVVTGAGTTWGDVIPIVETGSDLLTDGAMENWTADDLDSWTESNCDAAEDVSGETGSAAQVTVSADNGAIYQDITVLAETWYRLAGYYKNTAGDVAMIGVYDNDNGDWISPDGYRQRAASTSFDDFDYLFKTPTGCTSVRIYLGAVNNGDIVWFDTVTVKQVDTTNSALWSAINITTRSWTEIFELSAGPQVTMTLKYGETSPPTTEVEKMEILSAIVTGRYYQVEITITDPASEVNAMVNDFVLKFLQQ